MDDKITYNEKYVAFLDILGFKDKIKNSSLEESIELINIINNETRFSLNSVQRINKGLGVDISVRAFSDCFSISTSFDIEQLIWSLIQIQRNLVFKSVFVRGGLSSGRHFENERMIFSKGLVYAYELAESDKYPRILVDNAMVTTISGDYLMQLSDRKYFINYLYDDWGGRILPDKIMPLHKRVLMEEINNSNDHHILEKYRWLAEYHNNRAEYCKADKHMIDIDKMF